MSFAQSRRLFADVREGPMKKIFVASSRLDRAPPPLVRLASNGRVGIVMNALDGNLDLRDVRLPEQASIFADCSESVEELDLRDFFDEPARMRQRREKIDLVWINGGNTFVLRRAMFTADSTRPSRTFLLGKNRLCRLQCGGCDPRTHPEGTRNGW